MQMGSVGVARNRSAAGLPNLCGCDISTSPQSCLLKVLVFAYRAEPKQHSLAKGSRSAGPLSSEYTPAYRQC
jgi:hypothetical protein